MARPISYYRTQQNLIELGSRLRLIPKNIEQEKKLEVHLLALKKLLVELKPESFSLH